MTQEPEIVKQAKRIAQADGYFVSKVWKVCIEDCDGDIEVLFTGRWRGLEKAHIKGEEEQGNYAVVVRGDGTGYVTVGW